MGAPADAHAGSLHHPGHETLSWSAPIFTPANQIKIATHCETVSTFLKTPNSNRTLLPILLLLIRKFCGYKVDRIDLDFRTWSNLKAGIEHILGTAHSEEIQNGRSKF